jgi:hypothetical protein
MSIVTKSKTIPSTKTRSRVSHQQALVAITEVILQYGNIDDLIPQLIATVQQVMQVDNVAILRLDATGKILVMDTVRGPEEEVADQVRVPVGQGVAGRIVASGAPDYGRLGRSVHGRVSAAGGDGLEPAYSGRGRHLAGCLCRDHGGHHSLDIRLRPLGAPARLTAFWQSPSDIGLL